MTICTPWRVAAALNQLNNQINAKAPNRSKASDGAIGDPAHQAEACASQHNSCCVRLGGTWIIRARDFTNDPAHGADMGQIAEALRKSRDPRIRYIIFNKKITGPNHNWEWRDYHGDNDHTNHMHVSVFDTPSRFDDTSPWQIGQPTTTQTGDDGTVAFYILPDGAVFNENGVLVLATEFPESVSKRIPLVPVANTERVKQLTKASVVIAPKEIASQIADELANDPSNPLTVDHIPAIAAAVQSKFATALVE